MIAYCGFVDWAEDNDLPELTGVHETRRGCAANVVKWIGDHVLIEHGGRDAVIDMLEGGSAVVFKNGMSVWIDEREVVQ